MRCASCARALRRVFDAARPRRRPLRSQGRAGQCSAQSEAEAAPAHRLTHLHRATQLPCTAAARSDERRQIRS